MEGGLSIEQWVRLYAQIHQPTGFGWARTEWPDGGCLMDQPAIAVEMFDLIDDEFTKEAQAKSGEQRH